MTDRPTTEIRPTLRSAREAIAEELSLIPSEPDQFEAGAGAAYAFALSVLPTEAEAAHDAAPGEYTIDDGEHTWKFEGATPRAEGLAHDPVPVCDRCHELIVMDDDGDWLHADDLSRPSDERVPESEEPR